MFAIWVDDGGPSLVATYVDGMAAMRAFEAAAMLHAGIPVWLQRGATVICANRAWHLAYGGISAADAIGIDKQ
jgi:hypothetical protein